MSDQSDQPASAADQSIPESIARWVSRIGKRVVVRHRLDTGQLTDAVGELAGVDGADAAGGPALRVLTRDGETVIALQHVQLGKVVPPRPSRPAPPHLALSLGQLERLTARHWAAAEQEDLGDWLLRASGGFTGRANSVLVQGDPGLDLPAALAAVQEWYASRGLPALASLALPADAAAPVAGPPTDAGLLGHLGPAQHVDGDAQLELRAGLDRLGWVPGGGVSAYCLTAPVAALRTDGRPAGPVGPGLSLVASAEPGPGWLATYRYRGQEFPAQARWLLLSAPEQAFFSIVAEPAEAAETAEASGDGGRGGHTVAVARGSVAGGWGCITAVDVAPSYRRQGLARVLLRAIADWAANRGAASMLLQTAASNGPAQRLYLSAGFVVHHRYDYLVPPPG